MQAGDTHRVRYRQSLAFKVVFWMIVALVVTSGPFFYAQFARQRSKLIAQRVQFAADQSDVVQASLRHGMLTNDRGELDTTLGSLVDRGGLLRIWIIDKSGTVRASADASDVGQEMTVLEPTCQLCHGAEGVSREATGTFRDSSGRELIRTLRSIENDTECHRCHDPQASINGVILADFTISDLSQQAAGDLRELLLTLAGAVTVTGVASTVVLRRTMLVRVRDLAETTRQLARGYLDQRARPRGSDEIAELGGSLNAMADSLQHRTAQLTQAKEEIAQKAGQLRRLLAKVVRIQEEERRRIALDMHDSLMQLTAGALLESQAARESLASNAQEADERLAAIQALLMQMEGDIRRTIHDLRPPLLKQEGLVSAIRKHARSYQNTSRLACSVEVLGRPVSLTTDAEVAVYRIVQEALANVRRHSGARSVRVLLEYRPRAVRVTVEDDGQGFDWQSVLANPGQHLGLAGMRERSQSLDGRLEVQSAPGEGTRIVVEVPYEPLELGEFRDDRHRG